jgi:hypothetical protein
VHASPQFPQFPPQFHLWLTEEGDPARPEMLTPYRIKPLPPQDWIGRYADRIKIGSPENTQ